MFRGVKRESSEWTADNSDIQMQFGTFKGGVMSVWLCLTVNLQIGLNDRLSELQVPVALCLLENSPLWTKNQQLELGYRKEKNRLLANVWSQVFYNIDARQSKLMGSGYLAQ